MGMIYFPVTEVMGAITQPVQPSGNPNADFIVAFIAIPMFVVVTVFAAAWLMNRPKGPKQIVREPRVDKKAPEQLKAPPEPPKEGSPWSSKV